MKIRNIKSNKVFTTDFPTWKKEVKPKRNFQVIEWGDLVVLRAIGQFADRTDIEIMERSTATNRIKNDPNKYDFRVATHQDLQTLRIKYYIAEDYIEGLTFDELYDKQYKGKYFRPTFKEMLTNLYSEGLISSLPIGMPVPKILAKRSNTETKPIWKSAPIAKQSKKSRRWFSAPPKQGWQIIAAIIGLIGLILAFIKFCK